MARRKQQFIKGVRGKIIDRIVIENNNNDYTEIDLRFKDGTSLGIQIGSHLVVEGVDLLGWKAGNSHVIKKLA